MTTDKSDTFCVIGAGPAGLLAARALAAANIPYEQFEKNPDVGGIWDIRNDWSPMYESAHFISSKGVSHLPGFPMPDDYPDYPNHRQIFAYLKSFAEAYALYPNITFGMTIERTDKEGDQWLVTLSTGETRRYRGLFLCSGNTWDPSLPKYVEGLTVPWIHAVDYEDAELFKGKRVLVVGGGNSGCDIACDAATHADEAYLSLRRGYHFIPKYIFGKPADEFADGVELPRAIERRLFEGLLKMTVGDLRRYGLPEPDHRVMESHPIMNTQVLHHLGHGDLTYRPDIDQVDGDVVSFTDGSTQEVDLVVFATGYLVTYPFMDRGHFEWISKYPDLYLSGFHREYDNVCVLGLHQTDGGAFDFFAVIADMMCNFIRDQDERPARARELSELKRHDRPDLSGGLQYVKSARHATYVKKSIYKKFCAKLMKRMEWRDFGLAARPPRPSDSKVNRSASAEPTRPRVGRSAPTLASATPGRRGRRRRRR